MPGARSAAFLAVALGGASPLWGAAGGTPLRPPAPAASAMADTERYCTGYERTFHGEWSGRADPATSDAPVLFRIGVNADGKGCYAQLNVMIPPGIAPYELSRFRAKVGDGGAWTLRYRDFNIELDAERGTAVRYRGGEAPQPGMLFADPPRIGDVPPAPPVRQRERWYGEWHGRLTDRPFPVTLRFSDAGDGHVRGRISMLLIGQSFTGRFFGDMLVFRWRNRHVGLRMGPGGDTLVYTDYKRRVFRFRRRE